MSGLHVAIKEHLRAFSYDVNEYTGLWALDRLGRDPFLLLISIVLSQNTSDINSIRALNNMLERGLTTPDKILSAGDGDVVDAIKVAGQYRSRLRIIKGLSRFFIRDPEFQKRVCEDVERSREILLGLWGIGEKTADVFLSLYCDSKDVFPVDRHILRITSRIMGGRRLSYTEASAFWREAGVNAGVESLYRLHLFLISVGRNICRPRKPRCDVCPFKAFCLSSSSGADKANS